MLSLDERDEERSKKLKATEDTETLQLFYDDEERIVKVSPILALEEKENLVQCLRANSDVFMWSVVDMSGVDLQVIIHKLNVLPKAKPVKQKERRSSETRDSQIVIGKVHQRGQVSKLSFECCHGKENQWQVKDVHRFHQP
ncbi:inositol phosphorylceramide glucuronosyltransferase 1 [Gossypium australe]|uniref:Inositol phosphorylceramide glucuronosyltransferase 1 n=1 Tax=Gossypium australe TaxID=47621 RepID=A0A5B6VD76_9ROSI|nr:inositol phosphorylceramide glucuronosyltransferase 1 [Gossypium australe]